MSGHRKPEAVRFVHNDTQVLQAVLRHVRRHGIGCHVAAAGHDLDDRTAAAVMLANSGTQRFGAFEGRREGRQHVDGLADGSVDGCDPDAECSG
ncbi:hypothetical protein ACFYWN_21630 [Streptomyces sp. NPDC002917]|uniref:hypothetical protein n=1 Tax=Streptomyces sp. NPDC002917 TaxID=3364671 RepID=UPI0036A1D1E3